MKYTVIKRRRHDRVEPKHNYLKYFRVVRHWMKIKYDIGLPELEMLLFLHGEGLFKKADFIKFQKLISWDIDRFDNLLRDGWIIVWRKRKGKEATLYEISFKGKRMITHMYKILNGEEMISEDGKRNPMFKKNAPYKDKLYRGMIKRMNEAIKQSRRPSAE
jgi:hypothetical protein